MEAVSGRVQRSAVSVTCNPDQLSYRMMDVFSPALPCNWDTFCGTFEFHGLKL